MLDDVTVEVPDRDEDKEVIDDDELLVLVPDVGLPVLVRDPEDDESLENEATEETVNVGTLLEVDREPDDLRLEDDWTRLELLKTEDEGVRMDEGDERDIVNAEELMLVRVLEVGIEDVEDEDWFRPGDPQACKRLRFSLKPFGR